MKTLSAIIITAIIAIIIAGCTTPERPTTDISVLIDRTEAHRATPAASDIFSLYDFKTDIWAGADFHLLPITDKSYNHRTYYTLPPGGNRLNASEYARKREVKQFETTISTHLDSLSTDTVGYEHSSVYIPLAEELNRLATRIASRRILVIYSDLMENSSGISFYNTQTLAALKNNPETITARLAAQMPLQPLDGITVYIIFDPASADIDNRFRIVSGYYKTLLEDRGATVVIAANIPAPQNTQ